LTASNANVWEGLAKVARVFREVILYGGASGLGLAFDIGLLWFLVDIARFHYLAAAGLSFMAGTVIVYLFSICAVFDHRSIRNVRVEFLIFAGVGTLGLITNLTIMRSAVEIFGIHYMLAKLLAAAFTFVLNFGLRRALLFTRRRSIEHRRSA
jgi:putative flippase GtrA